MASEKELKRLYKVSVIVPVGMSMQTFEGAVQELTSTEYEDMKELIQNVMRLSYFTLYNGERVVTIPGPVLQKSIIIIEAVESKNIP
jgi:hypothetical protein